MNLRCQSLGKLHVQYIAFSISVSTTCVKASGSCVHACSHALVVFGGVQGLETSLDADDSLDIDEPSLLFDHYLNTCPQQGSNTIRTEVRVRPTDTRLHL